MIDQFIADCRAAAANDGAVVSLADILQPLVGDAPRLVEALGSLPEELPAMGWEEVLFSDDTITIMSIVTPPGIAQPPHDHRMAAIIGVFEGCEDQRFYRRNSDGLTQMRGRAVKAGEVLTLGKATVHAISTDGPEPARAVHVYLGPLAEVDRTIFDPETLEPLPFTLERYSQFCHPM